MKIHGMGIGMDDCERVGQNPHNTIGITHPPIGLRHVMKPRRAGINQRQLKNMPGLADQPGGYHATGPRIQHGIIPGTAQAQLIVIKQLRLKLIQTHGSGNHRRIDHARQLPQHRQFIKIPGHGSPLQPERQADE